LLDEELSRATIVPDDALPPQTVALDSRVRFQDDSTGRVREVTLVVPSKVSPDQGLISVLSPVGSALIGLSVHDDIDWPLPDGRLRRLRVLDVA
jgi:regulator of nucleoside diphosphate kinase